MAHLVNKDFIETTADSHNYLTWATYIKIILTERVVLMTSLNLIYKLWDTTKYKISHFLRHHIHLELKNDGNDFTQTLGCTQRILWSKIGQSFCQKHDTSSHYFALWTSNLSQNTILQCSRFVASFNFCDQTIDNAKIIKKTLSKFYLFQIGYCNNNIAGTTSPNFLISYMTYSQQINMMSS